jgi:type IV pilus assembly protein PilA
MKRQKGFSLIELLIVVAIILIIAAIAIPNFMRSKMAANEASAVSSLRVINTGEITYASAYTSVGYSAALKDLGGSPAACAVGSGASQTGACLIDNVLALASSVPTAKSGYYFLYAPVGNAGTAYTVQAPPAFPGITGGRFFFTDQTNVIRYGLSSQPDPTSSAL